MKDRLMMAASLALAWGLAAVVVAEPFGQPGGQGRGTERGKGDGPGMGGPGGMEQVVIGRVLSDPGAVKTLGLTDAQVKTLRNGLFDIEEQKAKLKADMEVAAIHQARLLSEDKVDEKAVMDAVEKTGAIRTEMAKTEMKALLLVRSTLNADQREKVREMIHRRMENMRNERGNGGFDGRSRGMGERRMHEEPGQGRGTGPQNGPPPDGPQNPPPNDNPPPAADQPAP